MSIFMCTSYYEVIPTLDEIRQEIYDIVGLTEIKHQLETMVDTIIDAKKQESSGFTVIPPKPFHTVFVGNNGTGKSMVARIIGKIFYLAGALSSFSVTEIQGDQKVKAAGGGVLVVNVDEEVPINPKALEDILALMDDGDSAVIFTGNYKALNRYMRFHTELYKQFAARLQFDDFSCKELAMIILMKANAEGENSLVDGVELDDLCTTDNIARVIAQTTPGNLRSMLNAHLLDQMLIEANKICLTHRNENSRGKSLMSLDDLAIGIQHGAQIYMQLLNL